MGMEIHKNINLKDMDGEVWAVVPKCNGRYLASSFGRIKSMPHEKKGRSIAKWITKERILRQTVNRLGYPMVTLKMETGERKIKTVHRLVLTSFKEPEIGRPYVNHKDGVKLNNNLNNLEYCTASENVKHARRTGLSKEIGETSHSAKITNKDAIEIFNSTKSSKELASEYNVSRNVIYYIKRGKSWGHLTGKKYNPVIRQLNRGQKLEIFNSPLLLRELADIYGVSISYVSLIKSGKIASKITGKVYKKVRKYEFKVRPELR